MKRRFCPLLGSILRHSLVTGILILFVAEAASAQWLNIPLPGTPRTADGKPNLNAPAPKTPAGKPDLSGIWRAADGKYLENLAADEGEAPFQPASAALYKERVKNQARDRPSARCLPHAVPDNMMVRSGPFKIIQTPGVIVILFEEFNHFRQIFTDGRGFPKQTDPTWFGYSIGKWEGDTLVVDTIGYNDRFWFDFDGHPHTTQLHTIERFTRTDLNTLSWDITIIDPGAYQKPFTVQTKARYEPSWELMEYICQENNTNVEHIQGPAKANR